jgi:YihY family inner membrane protein
MSSVTRVPETSTMTDELDAGDARDTLRSYGTGHLVKEAFARFRYGDGFSHSRALGLQVCLSFIPLVIALVGLSSTLNAERAAEVLRRTLLSLTPGTSSDVIEDTLAQSQQSSGSGGQLALWLGLATAVLALTTAMAQVERGANRIYGVQRDRPTSQKYTRALIMAVIAGAPAMTGFLIVVAGGALGDALEAVYGISGTLVSVLRWPLGVLLMLVAITTLFDRAPRRRQPGFSWLAVGGVVSLLLWLLFTVLLAFYVQTSAGFGTVYGPLTGIIALLLWAQLTSVALFLGMAFAAQLEAVRAGVTEGATPDPELATDTSRRA